MAHDSKSSLLKSKGCLSQTLHGTAVYAAPLTPLAPPQCMQSYGSPRRVVSGLLSIKGWESHRSMPVAISPMSPGTVPDRFRGDVFNQQRLVRRIQLFVSVRFNGKVGRRRQGAGRLQAASLGGGG